ncbi:MAG: 3-oxoacyl-ACP reductase FabG [Rhodospirillales bacterium]|nr:3-oxoacyl-ACP reductase FabG [Rhodospirillales bacterium]
MGDGQSIPGSSALLDAFALTGKVALVTGSGRGLGWGMARFAAQAGAHVVLNGRDEAALRARAEELRSESLAASVAAFDVTDADAIAAGVRATVERCGHIDILVNNAGIQNRKPFHTYTPEEWRRIVGTHLDGAFLVTRAVVPHMLARRSGRIIMIGSIAGERVRGTITAYAAAKGALAALVRALAVELGPHGITCNGIAPGFFATDFTRTLQEDAAFNRYISERVPLGRWGRPEELGPAVVYLASSAGAFVNGHILTIDGGLVAAA